MKRHAHKHWRTGAAVLAAAAVLAGCTAVAPAAPASEAGVPQAATATQTTHDANSSAGESTEAEARVELQTFSAQESTFLSSIESILSEQGEPDGRFYVQLTAPDGATWQGERLDYSDKDVYILQQAEGGGRSGVRMDAAPGVAPEQVAARLPAASTSGKPSDVEVQFLRARLNDPDSSTWTFDVTVAHPDTGWEDYADGWHVESSDGRILGMRILLHPHVDEQPFTRSLGNVVIPETITEIRIRPHDLVSGYGSVTDPIQLSAASTSEWFEVVR